MSNQYCKDYLMHAAKRMPKMQADPLPYVDPRFQAQPTTNAMSNDPRYSVNQNPYKSAKTKTGTYWTEGSLADKMYNFGQKVYDTMNQKVTPKMKMPNAMENDPRYSKPSNGMSNDPRYSKASNGMKNDPRYSKSSNGMAGDPRYKAPDRSEYMHKYYEENKKNWQKGGKYWKGDLKSTVKSAIQRLKTDGWNKTMQGIGEDIYDAKREWESTHMTPGERIGYAAEQIKEHGLSKAAQKAGEHLYDATHKKKLSDLNTPTDFEYYGRKMVPRRRKER